MPRSQQLEEVVETYSVLDLPRISTSTTTQQIAFSRRFGELEKTQGHIANNFQGRSTSTSIYEPRSGREADGGRRPARLQYRLGQRNWHSDSSFKRVPAKAPLLHARVLPPDGGDTQFASLRAAYDALPEARKRELEDKAANPPLRVSRRGLGFKLTNEAEDKRFPPVAGAVRANAENGRKALYACGSHASHIVSMPEEEGSALLKELLEFATQEQFTYLHHWKVGRSIRDVQDNRAALHRARPVQDYRASAHPAPHDGHGRGADGRRLIYPGGGTRSCHSLLIGTRVPRSARLPPQTGARSIAARPAFHSM